MTDNVPHHALVFDSGVGGLSVSAAIRARLQCLRQSYLADDAFRPYGDKSEAALNIRIPSLLAPLSAVIQPDLVVVACNTASTTALPAIRAALDVPVVGVVPAIKPAAAQSKLKRIGVLGTPGTVRRRYVDDLIAQYASNCEVRLQGSVNLVEQAERLLRGEAVDDAVIQAEITPLFEGERIDAVVLACTHFPLLIDALKDQAPYPVDWIDSGDAVARRVESLLSKMKPKTVALPDSQTAFLTGTHQSPARAQTFKTYGFDRIVSLPETR
ncbi:MAG: glutamate racemase [Pseudomonadota bacterium]